MPWMRDVLSSLLDWYLGALDQGGYWLAWVGGLMLFIGTLHYLFVHRQMRR